MYNAHIHMDLVDSVGIHGLDKVFSTEADFPDFTVSTVIPVSPFGITCDNYFTSSSKQGAFLCSWPPIKVLGGEVGLGFAQAVLGTAGMADELG